MLYTAESAQFNSPFSPTTTSLTPRFRRKREVWLPFFAENAQNDPKTHSYEDNAKFHSAFSPTALSYASRFQRNRGVIENFEYLCEFEDFRKCWFYCVLYLLVFERCKNKCKNRLWKSRACVPLSKLIDFFWSKWCYGAIFISPPYSVTLALTFCCLFISESQFSKTWRRKAMLQG